MANNSKKDKTVAAILAWFLGTFGIHRFYLGQNGLGVAYLLGSITILGLLITGPIALIDFIGLLIMPQQRFDEKYNQTNFIPNQAQGFVSSASGTKNPNVADELHKLDLLFKRGVITFEEFEKRKARLLNS